MAIQINRIANEPFPVFIWPFQGHMADRKNILDLYFLDARARLIDIAAFMDRVNRAEGETDFRYDQFQDALKALESDQPNRAENVLLAFSDPTNEPIPVATTKAACGAWPGEGNND